MKQILDSSKPNKIYSFYHDKMHNIVVQFEWNSSKDTIIAGTFNILTSEWEHEITATNICTKEKNHNYRLELHTEYVSKKPAYKSKKITINNLKIKQGETIQLCFVRYHNGETYDSKYHCNPYSIGIPDVKKGNILVGG